MGRRPSHSASRSYGAVARKAGSCDNLQVEKAHDGPRVVLPTREGDSSPFVRGSDPGPEAERTVSIAREDEERPLGGRALTKALGGARESGALQPGARCHGQVAVRQIRCWVGDPRPCGASGSSPTAPRQGTVPGVSRWPRDLLGSWKCRK